MQLKVGNKKVVTVKERSDKWDLIKIKNFSSSKDTIRKQKGKPQMREHS